MNWTAFVQALGDEDKAALKEALEGLPNPLNSDEMRLAILGEKIKAIHSYRRRTGATLKYAKDLVEGFVGLR